MDVCYILKLGVLAACSPVVKMNNIINRGVSGCKVLRGCGHCPSPLVGGFGERYGRSGAEPGRPRVSRITNTPDGLFWLTAAEV